MSADPVSEEPTAPHRPGPAPSTANEDVWVIVPTYNEASVVREVVAGIREFFPHVVGVDDGSSDGSAGELAAAGARVVRHPINMGAGAAIQTGVDFALRDPGAELFVMMDADGQHAVSDAVEMVEAMRTLEVDVLLGSRFLGKQASEMPASRRALLRTARVFERMTTGIPLTDAHQGLRVFRRSFAEVLDLHVADMAWASEFLARVSEHGARVAEHPVTVQYTAYSRAKGQRSINSVNIGVDVLLNRLLRGHR